MGKTVKERVAQVMDSLATQLLAKKDQGLSAESARDLIERIITDAYNECDSDNEKKSFYKELSRVLHPDKFLKTDPGLYIYLGVLELHDEPFKVLNNLHEKTEKYSNFWKNVIKNPMLLFDSNSLFDNPLEKNIRLRYADPFNNILMFFAVGLAFGITILAVSALTVAYVPINIAQAVFGLVLSGITGGLYSQLIENYKLNKLENAWSSYLNNYRNTLIGQLKDKQSKENDKELEEELVIDPEQFIRNMDDEKFWKYALDEYITEKHGESEINNDVYRKKAETDIKRNLASEIEVDSLDKMKFAFHSLYEVITLPMEQVKINKNLSLYIVRPLQVIASPFLLAAVAIGELAELTAIGAFFAAVAADVVLFYSLLAAFNLPLYAYDLAKNVVNYFSGNEKSDKNAMGQLLLEWKPSAEQHEQAPGHHPSPISSPVARNRDRNEHQAPAPDSEQPGYTR